MVLFKRKPVLLQANPTDLADATEVFLMKGTNEVFTDYEAYLKRFDYLSQKKFTDAVNGTSGLTFFDALRSERISSKAIETVFPEVVKDPILRRVQFSTISRIDDLVNIVFDEFKRDFFPGEEVIAILDDGEHHVGVIREKAKFPEIKTADGTVHRSGFSRYLLRIEDTKGSEDTLRDDIHIRRDKKIFTKQNLRAFLKNSLQREGWVGAPWLVKEHLAAAYRLPMEIPVHLLQETKILANKQMQQAKPPKPSRRSKAVVDATQAESDAAAAPPPVLPPPAPKVEVVPQIKYPIEDLDINLSNDKASRPRLKFLNPSIEEHILSGRKTKLNGIQMSSLGAFLECWNTLNVQCEVYVIDSFTFDDFMDAMTWSESFPDCELLDEMHCAILKTLVDGEGNDQLQLKLPKLPSSDDSGDEDDGSIEQASIIDDAPARSTRSKSLRNSMIEILEPQTHNAAEFIGERSWQERIKARDFEDGGWQVIVIGLLYQLSYNPKFKRQCDEILMPLAPANVDPTAAEALNHYRLLDPNLRIAALQIISELSLSSKPVREFLEACAMDMTATRRRKTDFQKARRIANEKLQAKDKERKALLPANTPESPKAVETTEVEPQEDTVMTNGGQASDHDDDVVAPSARSLRRGQERKRKREEDAARREKERAEKAEAAKALSHQTKEFRKLLHEIEAIKEELAEIEEQILDCDVDLREANVQRTKLLGQDRFFNRYWWFERNGQPFGGLPTSSTAANGYANGRIWIQGPDPNEIGPYVNDEEYQREYRLQFRTTVAERRRHEEGPTSLLHPLEWGIIDDAEGLDGLIEWLDERGIRERKLRKELVEWRDLISQYMTARHNYLQEVENRRIEHEEEQKSRISTRHQTTVDLPVSMHPVLRWTNSMAIDEIGHIHSREPRRGKGRSKQNKATAVLVNRQGKALTRQGVK